MEYSAQQIATLIDGEVLGDPQVTVNNLSKIEEGCPGTLSFLGNPKYEDYLYKTKASIVIVNKDFKPKSSVESTLIRVLDPHKAFAKLLEAYNTKTNGLHGIEQPCHIAPTATIGSNTALAAFVYVSHRAQIGQNCKIYSNVSIGNDVVIGNDVIIHPGVKIYQKCVIGDRTVIHSNTVIGSDGFGFTKNSDGSYTKVPQIGNVIIEEDVEIGANTTIDSATLGSTIIRRGVKMDNLIQIAHNVEIGEFTAIASQAGISGSTKIGKRCSIGGKAGITGHLEIADDVNIGAGSGVAKSILKPGTTVLGSPAMELNETKKVWITKKKLPEMFERLNKLHHELEALKKKIEDKP
jgi:UDP-3-O-[3-hydroxymyristoyl] glucosamine N-acyltransferase